MAKRVVEYLTSDLSGYEIAEDSAGGTVEFGISGTQYVMDLSESELAEFNRVVAP